MLDLVTELSLEVAQQREEIALAQMLRLGLPQIEMGAGIAASPHCAERRICRCS